MRTDFPVVTPDMLVREAIALMGQGNVDMLPVVDGDTFVGVITSAEILQLDAYLGDTSSEA